MTLKRLGRKTSRRNQQLPSCLKTPTCPSQGFIDLAAEKKTPIFDLQFNVALFGVVITMAKDYRYKLDLSNGEFAHSVGFKKKILKDRKEFLGSNDSQHHKGC